MLTKYLGSYFLLGLLCSPLAQAGIVVGGTRFVFNGNAESMTFNVRNTSSETYLVQTKILSGDINATAKNLPLSATPPIFPLKAGSENSIRIIYTGGDLPQDRESLFWLTVAGIPSASAAPTGNTMQVALRNRMKLFYRPANLQGKAQDAYKHLKWSRQGNAVTIQNPTPYYVTLINLQVNNQSIDNAGMIAPMSTRVETWCPQTGDCRLQWQTFNDFGALEPQLHISPVVQPMEGRE